MENLRCYYSKYYVFYTSSKPQLANHSRNLYLTNIFQQQPCYIAVQKAFLDQSWLELASTILKLPPQILETTPLMEQYEFLRAVWAIVFICAKRSALNSLESLADRVKRYKQSFTSFALN